VDKRYAAFVHGVPAELFGDIDGPIDRDPEEPHRRIVTPDGYPSLTRYEVKAVYTHGAKIELKLESGRTHQIRVHMTSIGCPLIGDSMYRHELYNLTELTSAQSEQLETVASLDASIPRQALHAVRLTFKHPVLLREMIFEAPLPPDMAALEAILEQGSIAN
jgi:23S rRNA pseudouridine1911/1915/1917 synthase